MQASTRSSDDRARVVVLAGLLIALGTVLGVVERTALPSLPVPGLRLGLANVAVVVAIALSGPRLGLVVSLGRVGMVGALTGTLLGPGWVVALSGALVAWTAMSALHRWSDVFSLVGVSTGGAVAHAVAQLAAASALLGTVAPFGLLPISMLSATAAGILTGLISTLVVSRLPVARTGLARLTDGLEADGAAAGR